MFNLLRHSGNIRSRLRLLLLMVLVPVILVQSGYLFLRFQSLEKSAIDSDLEIARAVKQTLHGLVWDVLHQELTVGMNFTTAPGLTVEQMNAILVAVVAEYTAIRALSWYDPQINRVIASSTKRLGFDYSDRDYVRLITSGRNWVVSDLVISRAPPHTPIFTISRGIRDTEGKLLGIVIAGLDPDRFDSVLQLDMVRGGTITILDSQGRAVYRFPKTNWTWEQRNLLTHWPDLRHSLEGREYTGNLPSLSPGKKVIAAFTPLALIGWTVGAERPLEVVTGPIRWQILEQGGLFLLLCALVFGVALVASESIATPIKELRNQAHKIARGETILPLKIPGPTEVQDLADSFAHMANEIINREERLTRSEERYRALINASSQVLYRMSPDWSEMRELKGGSFIADTEEPNSNWLQEYTHPDDQELVLDSVSEAVKSRTVFELEHRVRRLDGTFGWIYSRAVPVQNTSGEIMEWFGAASDITERKRAEIALFNSHQEKVALLKEVHHRVKNNLQIVVSLLGLQAGRIHNREALDILGDTRNRVYSMALLHETLYRSESFADIGFRTYIDNLTGHILRSCGQYPPRVRLENRVGDIGLPLDQAVPCGLILNELVSNALKHAFPNNRPGAIVVELERSKGHELVLRVRDDGVGLSQGLDLSRTTTLGLSLVHGLSRQLLGRLEMDRPAGGGTELRVVFPAASSDFPEE